MKKIKIKRLILLSILLVVIVGMFIVTKSNKNNNISLIEKDAKIKDLEIQIQKEEDRNKFLKEKQNYVPYEDYVEDIARNELGLIKENEIILRPKQD